MPMDEGMPVVYGDLVRRGLVPHRDFQTLYGPGMPWLVAAAYMVFGTSVETERAVGVIVRLALVAGVAVFAERWGTRIAILSGLISAVLMMPLAVYASAAAAAVACSVWSTLAVARGGGRIHHVIGGALAGAAIVLRPDYAAAAIAPAFILLRASSRRSRFAYVGGLILGLVPLALHAQSATPAALIDNLITDALRAVPSRRLPLPPANGEQALLLALIVCCVLWALWSGRGSARADVGESQRARELGAYGLVTAFLIPQVLQRADAPHVAIAACAAAPLFVIAIGQLSRVFRPARRLAGLGIAAAALFYITALVGTAVPRLHGSIDDQLVYRQARSYPDDAVHARQLRALIATADTYARPGMRLFIGPADLTRAKYNDTILYFLFPDLVPATYYLEMEPLTANRAGSRLASDIASADVLVLTSRWDGWDEPNESSLRGSEEPMRVVAERFRLVSREGEYALFVRRAD